MERVVHRPSRYRLFRYPRLCSGVLGLLIVMMIGLAQAGGWTGKPPLANHYQEHEFLAACSEGNLPAVAYYLGDGGVNVDDLFPYGIDRPKREGEKIEERITGIFMAVREGHEAIVDYLLTAGADPEQKDALKFGLLAKAARLGHTGIVKRLLATGINPNGLLDRQVSPLCLAAGKGYREVVQILLKAGASPHPVTTDGMPPRCAAAHHDHISVQLLLQHGANPNGKDLCGLTPLFHGIWHGQAEIVRMLLQAKTDPNQTSGYGRSPLFYAAAYGYGEIVKMLIDAGADTNGHLLNGCTLLLSQAQYCGRFINMLVFAATAGYGEIVKILLAAGTDPNGVSPDGYTPLMYAANNGHQGIVDQLVAAKANPLVTCERTLARQKRPLLRRWNPPRYDSYSQIIATLEQAERNWRGSPQDTDQPTDHRDPVVQHPEPVVTERTPLLSAMQQLSVSDK